MSIIFPHNVLISLSPVCGNGYLSGTNTTNEQVDNTTRNAAVQATSFWCTKYSVPSADDPGEVGKVYTKQHFARMWYNRLIDSPGFLNIEEGVDDPYSWTTGAGCGYTLAGERDRYTDMPEESILYNASRPLYYYDEGVALGVMSAFPFIGDAIPSPGEYSFENPLQKVGVFSTLYTALRPKLIVERVGNCKRHNGQISITEQDAEEILYEYKKAMEEAWSEGWDDDNAGEVQFIGLFDDKSVSGGAGRMLEETTLDNTTLMSIAIVIIAIFSVMFLFSFDWVESRVGITLIGVSLVILAYFAALGFALLIGIKINVTIAWTLPFIIIGLGVDNMYIVL
jgi:hypothetical protein